MDGDIRGKGYAEITQHYPRPGWVEHDPNEIWAAVQQSAREALSAAGASARDVAAIGITNQRETLVLWNRRTLEPIAPAIVWQDRRTADDCRRLREAGHDERVREVTGLVLDPYFTATKLAWALRNIEGAAAAAAGTVDSWLIARLSAGRDHLTDASNASRTLLFDLGRGEWSEEMADVFGVSLANLPEVVDSSGVLSTSSGEIVAPIAGVAGDQQAALFGLPRGTGRAHIVRAAVEAMAYQTRDVVEAMEGDTGERLTELRVDGGAAVMDVLCQLQADLLGIPVRRPRHTETTALGAAFLAGLGAGLWTEADLAGLWKLEREFEPRMSRDEADTMQSRWRRAVERSRSWERPV